MTDTYRLKVKVGEHEFDSAGDPDVVNAQFQAFLAAIAAHPAVPTAPLVATATTPEPLIAPTPRASGDLAIVDSALDRIMRLDGRIVSLTVRARDIDQA